MERLFILLALSDEGRSKLGIWNLFRAELGPAAMTDRNAIMAAIKALEEEGLIELKDGIYELKAEHREALYRDKVLKFMLKQRRKLKK